MPAHLSPLAANTSAGSNYPPSTRGLRFSTLRPDVSCDPRGGKGQTQCETPSWMSGSARSDIGVRPGQGAIVLRPVRATNAQTSLRLVAAPHFLAIPACQRHALALFPCEA
jgi:hypothetical protein